MSSGEPDADDQESGASGPEQGVPEPPRHGRGRSAPVAVAETELAGGAVEPARGLLPWPVAAAAVLGVLALMLGLGLWANQSLRPSVGVTPAAQLLRTATTGPATGGAPVASTAAPAPTLAAAAASSATLLPTTGPPVAAASPVAMATQVSAPAPPAAVPPAPSPAAPPPAPAVAASPATTAPSPRPTVDPVLVAEVGKAYERYWDVRAEALYNLDTSHLGEVSDGDGRQVIEQAIEKLRADGHAVDTRVEHRYRVISVSPDHAEVADQYADKSIYVDPISHEPLDSDTSQNIETAANSRAKELYEMQKIEDTWKVVKGFASD